MVTTNNLHHPLSLSVCLVCNYRSYGKDFHADKGNDGKRDPFVDSLNHFLAGLE
jgi:hypothetical protein